MTAEGAGIAHPSQVPWRRGAGCVIVRVRITPKSSKDAIDGVEETADGPALKARVRAVPADGAANAALMKLLAEWLGVPKSSVGLAHGGKSRVKSVEITGNVEDIEARLAARLGGVV
ncbi:hypothetical protein W911_03735 [Hyphomicrobium nitrativorans NL23]|uniref:UPF0235 protein W911_03735 n=1 Tax=Hyphomicrobium nitrativorans NL23 TaxID=1029756 RepID=V5SAC8_9HYPH|nr:hypothetical protein W911_03735 [Hyphomicrobium nitrativorans NL23]